MSLWGFLGAGLAYLLMTFAFVFGGIFWLCAEGNTLRETKRQSSIMSGIIVCTMGTWVIAFSIYITVTFGITLLTIIFTCSLHGLLPL
ncbi:hypothetical protein [Vibrio parahaemolyticus]|uniref:hypothetical protein n=1 Tax=Vibrio parahaemolyticus TaxID=670 RepID=UPI001F17F084|nr:hypothetical protein [Vibrio parahaemolyticus]